MKNISSFSQFIKESYGSNRSINWDLIKTAKELVLDYLDEGKLLRYMVYYKRPDTPIFGPFEVLDGTFSHDGDTFDWNHSYFDEDEIFQPENLFYIIWLPTVDESKEINDSLIFQLREIYPNENIK
jgi:hypothetical protein